MNAYCAALLALNTTMRSIEIKHLQWATVDMFEKTLVVSRKTTKTDAGERMIPLNRDAIWALSKMWEMGGDPFEAAHKVDAERDRLVGGEQ
jgi:integrase